MNKDSQFIESPVYLIPSLMFLYKEDEKKSKAYITKNTPTKHFERFNKGIKSLIQPKYYGIIVM